MSGPKTIVVTGANRGIGKAICSTLLSHPQCSSLTLYATSRRAEDLKLQAKQGQRVIYHQLDISDHQSITSLASAIKQTGNPLDVVINNGGANLDQQFSPENAKTTLDVNYRGTLNVCRAFIPLLRPGSGRIVNVSSTGSMLDPYSKELQHRFRNVKTLDDVEALAREYEAAVAKGKDSEAGFPTQRSYSVSKSLMNAFTKVLAKENAGLAINCCCPGWVNTDMGNQIGRPPKTPEDGAKIPVKLAVGDIGDVTGEYWGNDSVRSKEDGKVQPW